MTWFRPSDSSGGPRVEIKVKRHLESLKHEKVMTQLSINSSNFFALLSEPPPLRYPSTIKKIKDILAGCFQHEDN